MGFWTDLARTSMFLMWIGLCGAALLCVSRAYLSRQSRAQGLGHGAGAHRASWSW